MVVIRIDSNGALDGCNRDNLTIELDLGFEALGAPPFLCPRARASNVLMAASIAARSSKDATRNAAFFDRIDKYPAPAGPA
jgi:hypothetical protein